MKKLQNESKTDRAVRFLIAIVTAIASYYTHGITRDVWLIVTAIALISSLSGFSLFYALVGIKTLKR